MRSVKIRTSRRLPTFASDSEKLDIIAGATCKCNKMVIQLSLFVLIIKKVSLTSHTITSLTV